MRTTTSIVFTAVLLLAGPSLAGPSSDMASVLSELNHFPSEAHKETLAAVQAGDATETEKVLAGIISRIAHKPGDADKATLQKILASDATAADKTIAKAVLNMMHKPQAEDLVALKALSM